MTRYFELMKEALNTPSCQMCVAGFSLDPQCKKEIPDLSADVLNACVEEYFYAGEDDNRIAKSFKLDSVNAYEFYKQKVGECLTYTLTETYEMSSKWSNIESFRDELIAVMKVRNEE